MRSFQTFFHFIFLPTMCKCPGCSTFSPAFDVSCFYFRCSSGDVLAWNCALKLHILDNWWCWGHFFLCFWLLLRFLWIVCLDACMHIQLLSHVQLFVTPWTVAHQAPLSMGSSKQQYWSGLMYPPPEYLPDPRIETASLESPELAGRFFTNYAT